MVEDAQKALAVGFLPVITKVADFLKTQLAKPEVIQAIKDLGSGLAGAFDKAAEFAMEIPWGAVAGAVRTIGSAAKIALDFFNQMPDWAKQILIGGFVANKLTGGAISGIVGELGKGLIKGVLGMNAAVVNINAGVVNGGGAGVPGGPTAPAAAAAGAGGFTLAALAGPIALAAGIAAPVIASLWLQEQAKGRTGPGETSASLSQNPATAGAAAAWATVAEGAREWGKGTQKTNALLDTSRTRLEKIQSGVTEAGTKTDSRIGFLVNTTRAGLSAATAATDRQAAILRAKNFSPTLNANIGVTTNVSVRSVTNGIAVSAAYTSGGQLKLGR